MKHDSANPESSSGKFIQTVQPLRDLESNWTVDLAKNLEEYLLKICSGEISGTEDTLTSVNFAEAALLLQGSVQVYSRKVEYVYSLVLHALEFISQKSQEDQAAGTSTQTESSDGRKSKVEEDDPFWVSDYIAVEAKNSLDDVTIRDIPSYHFSRPPANLVVLEGECLDVGGEAGELESYLLATNDLYRDFILLDSCDAVVVDEFLACKASKGPTALGRGSFVASKSHKFFQSPSRRSGASVQKSSPCVDHGFESQECNMESSPTAHDFPEGNDSGFPMGDGYSGPMDSDGSDNEGDDPWKPLNPHEQGNLPVKPYKKLKPTKKLGAGSKNNLLTTEFPFAKLDGPISKELREIWEARLGATGRSGAPQPLPLYEKLRQSFFVKEGQANDAFCSGADNNEENGYESGDSDIGLRDTDMPDDHLNDNIPVYQETHDDGNNHSGIDTFEDPDVHASLEDLCRSHLDALLATFAETEKQTELATRVSTWKHRIERNLEEQDARPPFDIHKYGDQVLDKLSMEGYVGNPKPFGDVVRGQEKHDVARTFSALLQLVNNGDVELVKNSVNGTSTCYSDANPFHVRLLKNERRKGILLQSSKKRPKSPIFKKNGNAKGKENTTPVYPSPPGSTSSRRLSLRKASGGKSTPEGKKRRKSRFVAPLDLHLAG